MSNTKSPPYSIASAAVLSFLPVPLAFIRLIFIQELPITGVRIVAFAITTAFFGWISLSLYRGKKWSWWWVVVSTIAGTILMFASPQLPVHGSELVIYWLQALSIWVASLILLLPPNRKWFAA